MWSASNAALVPMADSESSPFLTLHNGPCLLGGFLGAITGHGAERMIFNEVPPRKTRRGGPVSLEAQIDAESEANPARMSSILI